MKKYRKMDGENDHYEALEEQGSNYLREHTRYLLFCTASLDSSSSSLCIPVSTLSVWLCNTWRTDTLML